MLFNLAEFSIGRVFLNIISKLLRTSKLGIDFVNKLLRIYFTFAIVFVNFEKSLIVVGMFCRVLKSLVESVITIVVILILIKFRNSLISIKRIARDEI